MGGGQLCRGRLGKMVWINGGQIGGCGGGQVDRWGIGGGKVGWVGNR